MNLSFLNNSKTWKRFGQMEVWGWGFFWFTAAVISLLSYTFDAVRLNNYSPMWIPINLIAFLVALALVYVLVNIVRSRQVQQPTATALNFLITAIGMGLKNALTFILCEPFGIKDSGNVLVRFLGGTTIGIAIFIVFGNLAAARIERTRIFEDLAAKERTLVGFRENIAEMFAEEELKLRKRTSGELLPRFEALQEKIELGSTLKSFTSDLQDLLSKEVRPLSAELARDARRLSSLTPESISASSKVPPVQVSLAKMIQPIRSYILTAFSWWMVVQIALPQSTVTDSAVAALIYLVTLAVLKLILLPLKPVPTLVALIAAPIVGFLGALPSYYLLYQIPHTITQAPLIATAFVSGAWVSLIFSHSYILDLGRLAVEARLKEVVTKFTKENKLFEQKLWIAQHTWYTLLHGSVQSALTAASIRASQATVLSDSDRAAILRDLDRAIDALRNPTQKHITLEESLTELSQTWEGICDLDIALLPEVAKVINASQETSLVVNEILKEAVSNAVKHGAASKADISVQLLESGDLEVLVSNNGSRPKPNPGNGIGTTIFSTLCMSNDLSWNNQTNRTELLVVIPMA